MIKKIILSLIALFFIFVGSIVLFMGYIINNPDSVFQAVNTITDKVLQGQAYQENEEFFLQGLKEVVIQSPNTEMSVEVYRGDTLKIQLEGKVPQFEQGPFITQQAEKEKLHIRLQEPLANSWFHININGHETTTASDSNLKAKVFLPDSYKDLFVIEGKDGNIFFKIPEDLVYEIDLSSVTGKIQNNFVTKKPTSEIQPQEVGHIKIKTVEGSITVEPLD